METKLIGFEDVALAVDALKRGEVIAFPTETVYGLAAIASKKEAFDKLVEIKKRTPGKPFTLMCSSISMAVEYADVNMRCIAVMKRFLPGKITLLLKARGEDDPWVTLGGETIGIRVPDKKEIRDLIDMVGCPLLVPSANVSNEAPLVNHEDVYKAFKGQIPYVIKGECEEKTPSTIINLYGIKPTLVREGPIAFADVVETYTSANVKIAIGSDHGGYAAKETIEEHLIDREFQVQDCGTYSEASCDYPDYAFAVSKAVVQGADFGIVVCTSGEGVCIAANRDKRIRCGIGYNDEVTSKMREHNNANVIAFGQKYMDIKDILRRVDIFLSEKFSVEEKHHRRVDKLS
ncbi:MAG: threonylcarbamoyl-AMP synthase [Bacilli bacterium]|nr:threonylcarbamoyl-AMP synthase [Bacilli bacterium]